MSQSQMSHNDNPVMDLANRARFSAHMEQLLSQRGDTDYALVAIDIKRFRLFNIWYGKQAGDSVLYAIAAFLQELRETKGYAAGYLGDDDFVLCMPNDQSEIFNIYKEIQDCLEQVKTTFRFDVVMGVCACSEDPSAGHFALYNYARIALAEDNPAETSPIHFFDRAHLNELADYHETMSEVNRAFENEEFAVYLQPQINSMSQRVVGFEALVRWEHPVRGTLLPDVFLPSLRQNGLEPQLDAYIWRKAIQVLSAWIKEGRNLVPVSVNVTLDDIKSMDVVTVITNLLNYYHVDPHYLEVEITESIIAHDREYAVGVVNELRSAGISVLMDDFGSGYSSLGLLKDMPVDVLKLDMSLIVFRQDNYKRGMSVLDAVANMARRIDLPLVVEGVQTQGQVYVLQAIDCLYVQGYFFHKPLPIAEAEELLSAEDTPKYWDIKLDYAQRSQTELGNIHVDDTSALNLRTFRIYAENLLLNALLNLESGKIHIANVSPLIARDYLREIDDFTLYIATVVRDKIVHPDDAERLSHILSLDTLRSRLYKDHRPVAFRFRELVGSQYRWMTVEVIPGTNISPADPWCAFSIREDALAEQLIGELDRAYTHDILTGLLNRNAFEKDLVELQLSESLEPYVVVYMDVVGLHEINNYTGHAAGDHMLQVVSDSARIAFANQKIYRIGGDEFIVLARGYDLERAHAAVGVLRKRLEGEDYKISVGCALCENSSHINTAYMEAEAAMRREKHEFYARDGAAEERNKLNEKLEDIITEKEDAERFLTSFMPVDTSVVIVNLADGMARPVMVSDSVATMLDACANNFTALLKSYIGTNFSGEGKKVFAELLDYQMLQKELLSTSKIEKSFTRDDGTAFKVWIVPYDEGGAVSGQTMWVFSRETSHLAPSI